MATYFVVHTRWPKEVWRVNDPASPMARVYRIVSNFFATCASPACVPTRGNRLLAYETGGVTL